MKLILLFVTLVCPSLLYSQDMRKLNQVDSIVRLINDSNYKCQRDTIKSEEPEMGISIHTFLTTVINGRELLKFEMNMDATMLENGIAKKMITNNAFYFNHNKLIKVEEFVTENDIQVEALWYYEDDKPLYYTLKTDISEKRAEILLFMAKSMVKTLKIQ